jgi:hypothetical protein
MRMIKLLRKEIMNLKSSAIISASILLCMCVAFFGYFLILGYSAAAPWPSFLDSSSTTDRWMFNLVTLFIPYVMSLSVLSYLIARHVGFWIAPVCIILVQLYFLSQGLSLDFAITMFVSVSLALAITTYFGTKLRNKALHQIN